MESMEKEFQKFMFLAKWKKKHQPGFPSKKHGVPFPEPKKAYLFGGFKSVPWKSVAMKFDDRCFVSQRDRTQSKGHQRSGPARWAPTSYKWSYKPYKWPYKWVTGVITLLIGVITPFITGRGPTLWFVKS